MSEQYISAGEQLSRRELAKIALGGALGATALGWSRSSSAQEQTSPTTPQAEASVKAGKTHSGPQPELLLLQNGFEVTLEWRNAPQDALNMHLTDAEMFHNPRGLRHDGTGRHAGQSLLQTPQSVGGSYPDGRHRPGFNAVQGGEE